MARFPERPVARLLGKSGSNKDYQLGYSNIWQRLTYTLSASQTYDEYHHRISDLIFISPFRSVGDDLTVPRRRLNLSNSTTFDNSGFASNNTGLNGIAGSAISSATGLISVISSKIMKPLRANLTGMPAGHTER